MRGLEVQDSFWRRFCKETVSFCESFFVKHIMRPVLFVMPPAMVVHAASKKDIQNSISKVFGEDIGAALNDSAFLIIFGAYIYVVLIKALYAFIKSNAKPERELTSKDLVAVIEAARIVTESKMGRICKEEVLLAKKGVTSAATTFMRITQPDQQLGLLIESMKTVFEQLDHSEASYRVGLLEIKDGKPNEWYCFTPKHDPPRTSLETLSSPTSTVSACVEPKSLIVIEDIQKELSKKSAKNRRFVKGSTQKYEQGSQLCYPIIHPENKKIIYVVTIAGNKKNSMLERYRYIYAWVLQHFTIRILLEHSLLTMKENANAE